MFAGEVDLKTWYKPKIDKKTLKELSTRSDIKGLLDISIFIVALILSGYLCILSWGTLWSIPALLLYGNIFYCKIISIQHETNHETYFKTRELNKFFYHITSLLGGFEAVRWKWSHFIIILTLYLHMKRCTITKIIVRNQQSLLDFF